MVGSFFLNFLDDFVPKGGRQANGDRLCYFRMGTGLGLSIVKGWVEAHGGRSPSLLRRSSFGCEGRTRQSAPSPKRLWCVGDRYGDGAVGVESDGEGTTFTLVLSGSGG